MGDYIEDALTEDEAAEGYVLTCQMRAEVGLRDPGAGVVGGVQDRRCGDVCRRAR